MNIQQRKEIIEKIKMEIRNKHYVAVLCDCRRNRRYHDDSKCWECLLEELE